VLLETRHVKAALSAMVVKTDRKDARGIAQLLRMGRYQGGACKIQPNRKTKFDKKGLARQFSSETLAGHYSVQGSKRRSCAGPFGCGCQTRSTDFCPVNKRSTKSPGFSRPRRRGYMRSRFPSWPLRRGRNYREPPDICRARRPRRNSSAPGTRAHSINSPSPSIRNRRPMIDLRGGSKR